MTLLAIPRPPNELDASQECLNLIMGFEGYSASAYPDPYSPRGRQLAIRDVSKRVPGWERLSGAPWTIGYGFTEGVKEGDTILYPEALDRLKREVASRVQLVRSAVKVDLTQAQFDALVSAVFNLGKIPKTMLAYLNGGVTDKGISVGPGDYNGAMFQFPRNCRAAGVPSLGLYRRRLAEACTFSGLPWENACSINVVRLELDPSNEINKVLSTSLEDTLLKARSDVPAPSTKPTFDFNKPWPKPAAPTTVSAPDDELILDTPIEKPAAEGAPKPAGEGVDTPTQHVSPSPPPNSGAPVPGSLSQPGPIAPQRPPAGSVSPPILVPRPPPPPVPVPIGQQTSAVDAAKNSADWSSGAKEMWKSRRFYGLALILAGRLWMLKTGSSAVLTAVSDPLVTEMFSGFCVMLAGEVIQHWGEKKATQPLK